MFDKTRQFVDDTRFLSAVIFKKEFYEANGIFHSQAMDRYSRYVQVNVDELPKEVNSSPLQTCFDDYKRLLNSIDVPDVDIWGARQYIQDHLSTDEELVGDAVGILETIQEQCGLLRNAVYDFAEVYGLTCKEEKEDDEKPAVKPAEKPADTDSPGMWEIDTNGERFTLKNLEFKKLYNFLTDEKKGIISNEITFDYFCSAVQRAEWGRIYTHAGTKKAKCRMVVTGIAGHATNKQDYRQKAAENMGMTGRQLGRYTVYKGDDFEKKLKEII